MGNLLKMFDTVVANHTGTPLQVIRFTYRNIITYLATDSGCRGCLVGNMAAEIASSSELCRQTMCSLYQEWCKRFAALISKGQDLGEIRNDMTAEALSDLFWNQWEGALLRMQIEGSVTGSRRFSGIDSGPSVPPITDRINDSRLLQSNNKTTGLLR